MKFVIDSVPSTIDPYCASVRRLGTQRKLYYSTATLRLFLNT